MNVIYRVVVTTQKAIDIEVPAEQVSKGFEAAQAYAKERGLSAIEDPDAHTYIDMATANSTSKNVTVHAYIKIPYPTEEDCFLCKGLCRRDHD